MLWYFFIGINFFILASLISRIRVLDADSGAIAILSRRAGIGLLLLSTLAFYPLLIAYFHLYPVSKPGHLFITLLLWSASLQGAVLCLGTPKLIQFTPSRARGKTRWVQIGALPALAGLAYWGVNQEMTTGSLLNIWSLLFVFGTGAAGVAIWINVLALIAGVLDKQVKINQKGGR